MKTTLEIEINAEEKPAVEFRAGRWVVTADVRHVGVTGRALWVRTWDPADLKRPKDGNGLLLTGKRKIKLG